MTGFLNSLQSLLDRTRAVDFLAPLALRLYLLVPIFWMSGNRKPENAGLGCAGNDSDPGSFIPRQDIIDWFGDTEWGLGLPFPELMAYLAAWTEYFGAILLLVGLAVCWIACRWRRRNSTGGKKLLMQFSSASMPMAKPFHFFDQ